MQVSMPIRQLARKLQAQNGPSEQVQGLVTQNTPIFLNTRQLGNPVSSPYALSKNTEPGVTLDNHITELSGRTWYLR